MTVCLFYHSACVFYLWLNKINSPLYASFALRRSGASSSCSSYYSTSAAKAKLLSQMKDFADSREKDKDDELTYKVTQAATVLLLHWTFWVISVLCCLLFSFFVHFLFKRFFSCCAEAADGEPAQEAGSAERSTEGAAGGHQSQRTAGRGGVETAHLHTHSSVCFLTFLYLCHHCASQNQLC